jgi:hypothetical protein
MAVPEHLWRFPTGEAIESLARRFDLPNHPGMQSWEWEVADPARINEFVEAYESGELNDDEKFTLMETIVQSFEELDEDLDGNARWAKLLTLIDRNISLHIHSVWHWSVLEEDDQHNLWRVTPYFRSILEKHRAKFARKPDAPD